MGKGRMSALFLGLLIIGVIGGSGCSTVVAVSPVGENPEVLEPEKWEGIWYHPGGAVTIRVVDGENGILEAGIVGKDEKAGGRLQLQAFRVHIRSSEDWLFASFRGPESSEPGYLWGRIKIDHDGKRILVWFPRPDAFAELVRAGTLPGKVDDKGNVNLGELRPEHFKKIVDPRQRPLFVWDEPLVLFKLSGL
jgi:hypothetical protein